MHSIGKLFAFVIFLSGVLFGFVLADIGRNRYLRATLIESCMHESPGVPYKERLGDCVRDVDVAMRRR